MNREHELEVLLQRLLNKVNVVTAYFRHHGEVPEGALNELVERQIIVEERLSLLTKESRELTKEESEQHAKAFNCFFKSTTVKEE